MNLTKIEELKSYSIPWNEVCFGISNQIKNSVGKAIICKENIDDVDFWGVRFEGNRMSTEDVKTLCADIGATEEELADALPYDGEDSVGSIGGSIVNKILSREIGIEWDLFYACEDRLILIGCRTIR